MSLLPSGVKIQVALGVTDMRKGLDGLAMLVQGVLKQDPFSGHQHGAAGSWRGGAPQVQRGGQEPDR